MDETFPINVETTEITERIGDFHFGGIGEEELVRYLAHDARYVNGADPDEPAKGTPESYLYDSDGGRPYVPGSWDEVRMCQSVGWLPWDIFRRVNQIGNDRGVHAAQRILTTAAGEDDEAGDAGPSVFDHDPMTLSTDESGVLRWHSTCPCGWDSGPTASEFDADMAGLGHPDDDLGPDGYRVAYTDDRELEIEADFDRQMTAWLAEPTEQDDFVTHEEVVRALGHPYTPHGPEVQFVQIDARPVDPAVLAEAVRYAAGAHAKQTRKRADGDRRPRIPYVSHLLGVAGLVLEDGGGQDEAVAALLHDLLEDQETDPPTRAAEVEAWFGQRVLEIVRGCSGPKKTDPGMADFRVRKQVYLDHLAATIDLSVVLVSLADKFHNARSTVNDLHDNGPAIWDRFNAGANDQLWWYDQLAVHYLAHARRGRAPQARARELARLVLEMRALSDDAGTRGR